MDLENIIKTIEMIEEKYNKQKKVVEEMKKIALDVSKNIISSEIAKKELLILKKESEKVYDFSDNIMNLIKFKNNKKNICIVTSKKNKSKIKKILKENNLIDVKDFKLIE